MTEEELLNKIDFEKSWLYECGIFGSDIDIAFHAIKKSVIETLEQEPCEDAVSRQAVIDEIEFYQINPQHFDFVSLIDNIKDLPSVNPQKIGHWIRVDDTKMRCSNCDIIHLIAQYPRIGINYCPNCGARMGGAE